MEKDSKFQVYGTIRASEVPSSELNYLIMLFMKEAEVNMGCSSDAETTERTIYHILKDFGWLPVSYIASAFVRGSLGKFGAGRLVPRTIHGWLFEVGMEYNRDIEKGLRRERDKQPVNSFDLIKYPIPQAIIQKLNWYKEGKLDGDEWDHIDLKALTEAIGRKEKIEFENFYK